jgi:hypothetical protein
MTTLTLRTGYPAHARRGFIRVIAAVTATVEQMFEVIMEA